MLSRIPKKGITQPSFTSPRSSHRPQHRRAMPPSPTRSTRNFFAALMNLKDNDTDASSSGGSPSTAAASSTAGVGFGGKKAAGGGGKKAASASAAAPPPPPDTDAASDGGKAASAAAVAAAAAAPQQQQPPQKKKLKDPLVWIDLEMTGLDVEKDAIIEIAVLVTDGSLNTVIEGPALAIHHGDDVLGSMNEWCVEHHGKSGLTQRCRESTTSLADAEAAVLAFVAEHVEYQAAQLAGNSVHVDRMFLSRHMPLLVEHLHYRIVDVSTIKELLRRWRPSVAHAAPRKKTAHTALADIRESLEELKYYRDKLFKPTTTSGRR